MRAGIENSGADTRISATPGLLYQNETTGRCVAVALTVRSTTNGNLVKVLNFQPRAFLSPNPGQSATRFVPFSGCDVLTPSAKACCFSRLGYAVFRQQDAVRTGKHLVTKNCANLNFPYGTFSVNVHTIPTGLPLRGHGIRFVDSCVDWTAAGMNN